MQVSWNSNPGSLALEIWAFSEYNHKIIYKKFNFIYIYENVLMQKEVMHSSNNETSPDNFEMQAIMLLPQYPLKKMNNFQVS